MTDSEMSLRQHATPSFVTLIVLFSLSSSASAWGPVGHETIAYIASDNLTPAAKRNIDRLLGPGVSFASVANWADQVRMFGRRETAPWHFIDIPVRLAVSRTDVPKFCPNHDCIVDQIDLEIGILRDPSASRGRQVEALKFLVHFVGDVHQPLHCADDDDRGGNEKIIRYRKNNRGRGTKLKLHAFWDHLAEVKTVETARELATKLRLSPAQKRKFDRGSAADWAWESHVIARDTIYAGFDPGPTTTSGGFPLPKRYRGSRPRRLVYEQLQKAGARLAWLLNEILD